MIRKLKLAAYVDRLLEAAESRLANRPWWDRDLADVPVAVRRAPIDQLAEVIGTWAGLKWLDAAEHLMRSDWLADTYPTYAPSCIYELSALMLDYAPHVTGGPLAVQVPPSGVLFGRGNTQVAVLPKASAGGRVYWTPGFERDTVTWSDATGRAIVPEVVQIPCALTPDGSAAVPMTDDPSGLPVMDEARRNALAEYLGRLPAAALGLIGEGRGLVMLSDIQLGNGDTRPTLLVRPEDLARDDYRDVARQLGAWLGAEFVRLYASAPVSSDLARMAVQHVCMGLEASGYPSSWLWPESSDDAREAGLNPLRRTVHMAVASTLAALADVSQPLPLSNGVVALLAPLNERAATKTRQNGLLPSNWYLVDHVSAFEAGKRQHVVEELLRGTLSEAEHYVIAACRYADGNFTEALEHARHCLRSDPDCMEYRYLAAFCERHLGQAAQFEARVFAEPWDHA